MLGQEIKFVGLTTPPYVTQGTNGVALSSAAEGFEIPARPAWQAASGPTHRAARYGLTPVRVISCARFRVDAGEARIRAHLRCRPACG
jgi:hypothetical protein